MSGTARSAIPRAHHANFLGRRCERDELTRLCLIGIGINVGIWINKYLIVMPALAPDDWPFDHSLDVILALGLLAGFVAVVILLARRFDASLSARR